MSALRFQHGILLATIVLIFPVPCHLGVQEHDIEEDIKREIADRLNNFVLQQLAKEKQKEHRIQYEKSHIKEGKFPLTFGQLSRATGERQFVWVNVIYLYIGRLN